MKKRKSSLIIISISFIILFFSIIGFIIFAIVKVNCNFDLSDAFLSLFGGLFASGLLTLLIEVVHFKKDKLDAQTILSPIYNSLLNFCINVSAIYSFPDYIERTYKEWVEKFVVSIKEDSTRTTMILYLEELKKTSINQLSILDSFRTNEFLDDEQTALVKWFALNTEHLIKQIEDYENLSNYIHISNILNAFLEKGDKLFDGFSTIFSNKYNLPKQTKEELDNLGEYHE